MTSVSSQEVEQHQVKEVLHCEYDRKFPVASRLFRPLTQPRRGHACSIDVIGLRVDSVGVRFRCRLKFEKL